MELRDEYTHNHIRHWDDVAIRYESHRSLGEGYHQRLAQIYSNLLTPGSSVLEIGCGTGDLLASLHAARAVGVDFSAEMLAQAREKHPDCQFVQVDAHTLALGECFDFVILSDLINDLWDVQTVLEAARQHCHASTRLILNSYSHLWQIPLRVSATLGLTKPNLEQNWLETDEIRNLLYQADFDTLRTFPEFLCPFQLPLIEPFFNRILVRFWPFRWLALTNIFVARPNPQIATEGQPPAVSVLVPARNEAGNIAEIFRRVPQMGSCTELIFVEGHSHDDTYQAILDNIAANPEIRCVVLKQAGVGKGDAVRAGFDAASGDILMILDADMTVPPEDLPRFYNSLVSGKGDFINGVRLVYPMEKQAMRFFNLLGNKFFSLAFSWLLGQPVGDTLCGTKVLWRRDYLLIAENRAFFGDFDPFGDYDLLFGASHLNLKIVDMPIRYRERIYGTTNIQRWQHGWLLLKMVTFAARRIKFI
jgi:SAM-dependent methyltransferase